MKEQQFKWQDKIKDARITIEHNKGIWQLDFSGIDANVEIELKRLLGILMTRYNDKTKVTFFPKDPKKKDQIIAGIGVK